MHDDTSIIDGMVMHASVCPGHALLALLEEDACRRTSTIMPGVHKQAMMKHNYHCSSTCSKSQCHATTSTNDGLCSVPLLPLCHCYCSLVVQRRDCVCMEIKTPN